MLKIYLFTKKTFKRILKSLFYPQVAKAGLYCVMIYTWVYFCLVGVSRPSTLNFKIYK